MGEIHDWVVALLGASDPEMEAIKAVCRLAGIPVHQALDGTGRPVTPSTAYAAEGADPVLPDPRNTLVLLLETDGPVTRGYDTLAFDHHRPGARGTDMPPSQFWEASTIGQLCEWLVAGSFIRRTDLPEDLKLVAAADHCLLAAYRGE